MIAAILVWRIAHWSARMVMSCLLLFVAETFQLAMGYDRHLGIHVPLGVLLAVMASFLYTWAYKPQATRASQPQLRRINSGVEKVGSRPRTRPSSGASSDTLE